MLSGKISRYGTIYVKFGEGAERRSTCLEVWDILGIEVHETKKEGNTPDVKKSGQNFRS